jgi:hypothetical protein
MHLSQFTAGALLALAAGLSAAARTPAQDSVAPPTYARVRSGADDWHVRGGRSYGPAGYGYGYGFFQPYVSPVVVGSWYARPYPYHFDYFRGRWGDVSSDSPCATDGVVAPMPDADAGM